MLIRWNPSLETGVEVVDAGHRLVVELINRLNWAEGPEATRSACAAAFLSLGRVLPNQFLHEEGLLSARGDAGAAEHLRQHGVLLADLARFRPVFMAGNDIRPQLLVTLIAWLGLHMRDGDHVFAVSAAVSPAVAAA